MCARHLARAAACTYGAEAPCTSLGTLILTNLKQQYLVATYTFLVIFKFEIRDQQSSSCSFSTPKCSKFGYQTSPILFYQCCKGLMLSWIVLWPVPGQFAEELGLHTKIQTTCSRCVSKFCAKVQASAGTRAMHTHILLYIPIYGAKRKEAVVTVG